jgi:hypothetical protein
MEKRVGNRRDGFTLVPGLLIIVLTVAVVSAAVLIFIVPQYRQHRTDQRRTFDKQSVATARDVCKIQYLTDGESGLVVYYYDELSHKALRRSRIGEIKPYGRCSRTENLHKETGAAGVPNLGSRGGAQLLAVAVSDGAPVNERWTGKEWTYLDYYYMTQAERLQLTGSQRREMDQSSARLAKSLAKETYEADFERSLKEGEDPGTSVYVYDALKDLVYYDEDAMKELDHPAAHPEKASVRNAKSVAAYDVEKYLGKVVTVTVSVQAGKVTATAQWTEGRH